MEMKKGKEKVMTKDEKKIRKI